MAPAAAFADTRRDSAVVVVEGITGRGMMIRFCGLAGAGVAVALLLSGAASAFPAAPIDSNAVSTVILAADKCGKANHRDEHGHCAKDDRDHCAKGRRWHEEHGRCEK